MQFIETLDGTLVPVNKIDKIWSKAGSVWIKAVIKFLAHSIKLEMRWGQ